MNIFQNKIVKNASWLIAGKVIQSLLAFVIEILTARYLCPSNYGLIAYASSLVAFLGPVMNLGLSNVLVQEFTNHSEEEGKIIGSTILLSVISAIACMCGLITYTFLVDTDETVTHIVVILYSIMLIVQAINLIEYWYQYKMLSKYVAIVSLCAYLIVSIYKFILLATKQNVYWFVIANSIDYTLIATSLIVIYKKLGGAKLCFDKEVAKRMLNSSKHYIVSNLMVTIFAQTDKIMIKLMLGESNVGYYTVAVACSAITGFVFTAIIDSFRPVIFQAKKNNDIESFDRNLIRLNSFVIYLSLLQCIVITIFAPLIINILYGSQYLASVHALRIVVWYTTFSYLGSTRNVWILAENKQKYLWMLNTAGALMNVTLNYLLIPTWGIYGAAFASLVTQFFTNIIMNMVIRPLKHNNYYIVKALNPHVILSLIKK